MPYRKFQADYLFTGTEFLSKTSILITDEEGKILNIINDKDAGEGVETNSGILSPGFINTHCHLELSHLKDRIPKKSGLTNFVYNVVTGRHSHEEEIVSGIANAVKEMIENGIVAVGDICNNDLAISVKNKAQLQYYNFIEVSGWNPSIASARFEHSKSVYDKYISKGQKTSMVPHAPYSVSPPLWEKITPYFSGKIVTIHNQETISEDEFFLKGSGKLLSMYTMMEIDNSFFQCPGTSSLQSYYEKLSSASSVILVHNTFIKQDDLDYICKTKNKTQLVSFCLCPNANLYIEDKLPPLEMLADNKVDIVIGTDSLASNHQLDILEELKTISKRMPSLKTDTMLRWATLNGAKALQMDNIIGSFEKGKQPGVVLIENIAGDRFTDTSKAKRLL